MRVLLQCFKWLHAPWAEQALKIKPWHLLTGWGFSLIFAKRLTSFSQKLNFLWMSSEPVHSSVCEDPLCSSVPCENWLKSSATDLAFNFLIKTVSTSFLFHVWNLSIEVGVLQTEGSEWLQGKGGHVRVIRTQNDSCESSAASECQESAFAELHMCCLLRVCTRRSYSRNYFKSLSHLETTSGSSARVVRW